MIDMNPPAAAEQSRRDRTAVLALAGLCLVVLAGGVTIALVAADEISRQLHPLEYPTTAEALNEDLR